MNLFILDEDIQKNVEYHVDKHVIKIIIEAAQLMSTAISFYNIKGPYKPIRICNLVRWCAFSRENYLWTYDYGIALCKEYTYRYNKIHKTQDKLETLKTYSNSIPSKGKTTHVLAIKDYCKTNDVVESYRKYYNFEKTHLFSWKKREVPYWISRKKI